MMAVLLLEGCDTVTVKDEVYYGVKGPQGAVAFHTLTKGQTNYTKAQWQAIEAKTPLICSSVSAFTDQKAEIEKFCSLPGVTCDYNGQTPINDFFKKIMAVKF